MSFLVGDVGGTNIRLALIDEGDERQLFAQNYKTALFTHLRGALVDFMRDAAASGFDATIVYSCLAVCGPVVRGRSGHR